MVKFILVYFVILSFSLSFLTKGAFAQNYQYACPLRTDDITGVMQWNDGWPFSFYNRATHGILPIYQPVDINGYYGSPILSPADGHVYRINPSLPDFGGGEEIVILGDDNQYYAPSHVRNRIVNVGDLVYTGEQIGNLVTKAETISEGRLCNLAGEFTATLGECNKIHTHFDVYRGAYENPSSASTLAFVSQYCGLNRQSDNNPEFPPLPTINCAKITGNPNINLCFAEKSSSETVHLPAGWNSWKVTQPKGQIPGECIARIKTNGRFIDVFGLADKTGSNIFIKCRSSVSL